MKTASLAGQHSPHDGKGRTAEGQVPGHIGSAVRRQRYLNEGSTCFLLCIQSGTTAHKMIPLTFRMGLPINPNAKLPLDVPNVCLLDSFKLTININCVLNSLPPMRCYFRSACSTPWVGLCLLVCFVLLST